MVRNNKNNKNSQKNRIFLVVGAVALCFIAVLFVHFFVIPLFNRTLGGASISDYLKYFESRYPDDNFSYVGVGECIYSFPSKCDQVFTSENIDDRTFSASSYGEHNYDTYLLEKYRFDFQDYYHLKFDDFLGFDYDLVFECENKCGFENVDGDISFNDLLLSDKISLVANVVSDYFYSAPLSIYNEEDYYNYSQKFDNLLRHTNISRVNFRTNTIKTESLDCPTQFASIGINGGKKYCEMPVYRNQ